MSVSLDVLKNMYFGDTDIISEVIATYLFSAPQLIADVQTAFDGPDLSNAGKKVHTLKGAAVIFGDSALATGLKEVDRLCKDGRLLEAKSAWPRVLEQTQIFEAQLKELQFQIKKTA